MWLEDLQGAADGAWVTVDGDSSTIVIVGEIIDPLAIDRVTAETNDNTVVSVYESDGSVRVAIQLDDDVHEALCQSGQSVLHLQMDEVLTKEELGLV